jgi:hypothetical protein
MKNLILCFVLLFGVGGCSVMSNFTGNKKSELTFELKPVSRWSDQHRILAQEAYLYAQMAANSYGQVGDSYGADTQQFKLPDNYKKVKHYPNDDIGFAYSVVDKYQGVELVETILVFRGTEGFFNYEDWVFGNIALPQTKKALKIYDDLKGSRKKNDNTHVPIVLVGHSLGGALAIHVAVNRNDNLKYYVFNTSPRFDNMGIQQGTDLVKSRHSIVMLGDPLKIFRMPGKEADQTYTSYDCVSWYEFEHSIDTLATCLTEIAQIDIPSIEVIKVGR